MEKSLNLHGKSEWAGARKVLAALKRARKIRGSVKLAGKTAHRRNPRGRKGGYTLASVKGAPSGSFRTLREAMQAAKKFQEEYQPAFGTNIYNAQGRLVKTVGASRNPRRRNIAGFMDASGHFHPIRSGERMISYQGKRLLVKDDRPYSRRKAHEKPKRRNLDATLPTISIRHNEAFGGDPRRVRLHLEAYEGGYRWVAPDGPTDVQGATPDEALRRARSAWGGDWDLRTTYASFMRQGRKRKKKANPKRLSKKQLFLRRMRLGRLRAARARARNSRRR